MGGLGADKNGFFDFRPLASCLGMRDGTVWPWRD